MTSFLFATTALLLLLRVANASLDPTSFHESSFTYSQAFELDLSQSEAEDDDGKEEEEILQQPSPAVVVGSELLYSGSGESSCLVLSSQTIGMESCSSDDDEQDRNIFTEAGLFQGNCVFPREFDSDAEDDDDDDDNDGHSSMLSNASLRARQDAVLNLRGGSVASGSLGSEISKKLFVTALVTLVFEGMIGHILEFLKIVMQTSDAHTSYASVLRQITAEKGIAGLWDGFCPWGVVQAVCKGAVFGLAYATAAGQLVPMAEQGKIPMQLALTLAGGIGGGFQGYILSPTLLLKTRVMTNEVFREKMSALRTTLLSFRIGYDVVMTEGLLALMKGSNVFATKRVFDWASRYFFADMFEALFTAIKNDGQPLSVAEKSASSLLGGVASTCVTLPLDVLVAKTQDAKKAGVKVSALKLFQDELQEKGLQGLKDSYMRGFEARLLHVCLTTLVIKTGTPIAYDWIFGPAK